MQMKQGKPATHVVIQSRVDVRELATTLGYLQVLGIKPERRGSVLPILLQLLCKKAQVDGIKVPSLEKAWEFLDREYPTRDGSMLSRTNMECTNRLAEKLGLIEEFGKKTWESETFGLVNSFEEQNDEEQEDNDTTTGEGSEVAMGDEPWNSPKLNDIERLELQTVCLSLIDLYQKVREEEVEGKDTNGLKERIDKLEMVKKELMKKCE